MIGFPLQLPIEASAPRSFRIEDGTKEIFDHNGEPLLLGRAITLSIRLTEAEAVAVRIWLEERRQSLMPKTQPAEFLKAVVK